MIFNNKGKPVEEEITLSTEASANIMEAYITDECDSEELKAFLENHDEVNALLTSQVLLEKNIVRLDKPTRIKRHTKLAAFELARKKKDPKFKKLLTVWRIERALEADIMKRFGAQGQRIARQQVMNARKKAPNSAIVKKVSEKLKNSLNSK